MAIELPNPFSEDEDTVRARFYATLDALFPNPATRPDLREGSLVDTILAPVTAELARFYDGLNYTLRKAFVQTADGLYLDNKGAELGVDRNQAVGSTGVLRFYGENGTVIPHATTTSTTTENPDAPTYSFNTDLAVGGIEVSVEDRTIRATPDPAARNEQQAISSSHTSGAFRLTYDGAESTGSTLPYNATAAQVLAALTTIAALAGKVTVSGGSLPSTPVVVEFTGTLAATNVPMLSISSSTMAGGAAAIVSSVIGTTGIPTVAVVPLNEVRTLAKTGTVSGGTFTLTYGADTTAAIAFGATGADIQAELEELTSVGVGNVAVSPGPLPDNNILIEFKNALGKTDLTSATFTVNSTGLTGGGSYGVTTTVTGAPGNGTNVTGTVSYKYTYLTRVGDSADEAYDAENGETAGSPVSVSKALVDQSVIVTIPPVPELTGLNQIVRVNIYRSLNDGGGASDYKYLDYVGASTTTPMTYTDNIDQTSFDSIEAVIPEENSTGVVDVSASANEQGAGTNAAPGTVTLLEDLVDGVTAVTNRSAFTGGADIEDDESYRTRLLEEIKKSPGAGNLEDYRSWAREVDGIENVSVVGEWESQYSSYPYDDSPVIVWGPGTVKVIVSDNDNSPVTNAKREEVRQYIAGDIAVPSPHEMDSDIPTESSTPLGSHSAPAGTYKYVFTWVNVGGGETPHHAINPTTGEEDEDRYTATISAGVGDDVILSNIPIGPTGSGPAATVKRRIYRKQIGGTADPYLFANYLYVGSIDNNSVTTFTDDRETVPPTNAKVAPSTNSTSKYNGKGPIGAHITVDTISEAIVTVSAEIVPEVGYNLAGTGGNIKLSTLIQSALQAAIRGVGAGETLYLSDIQNAIHDTEGVKDFRDVAMSQPVGCELLANGNVVPTDNNIKIVFSPSGAFTEVGE